MDPQARPSLVQRLTARAGDRAWHSEFREEVASLLRRPANEDRPRRMARPLIVAAVLLLSIPLTSWGGAHLLLAREESRIATLKAIPSVGLALSAEERRAALGSPEVAWLFARPTIGDIAERLAQALPREAAIHAMGMDADGALTVEIELPDPEMLRAMLAGDRLLRGLRQVSQGNGESGPRVRLFAAASPLSGSIQRPEAAQGVFDRLAAARRERTRLEGLMREGSPLSLVGERALRAGDAEGAAALLAEQLRRAGVRTGALVEMIEPAEAPDGAPVTLARVAASGSQKTLLSFIGEVEGAAPLVRFTGWRIEPSDGAMRLDARAAAVWEPER